VIDLAVGVIIGAAFGKDRRALVKSLIMPLVGRSAAEASHGYLHGRG